MLSYAEAMTDTRAQSTFQVRLGWGTAALTQLADADIVVVVDAIGRDDELITAAAALPNGPAVFVGTLRNATVTARSLYDEQLARGGRTAINLVLAGDAGGFAVEDYLAAGAIADGLAGLGIDHSSPDAAVANEGFRPLRRALKHLLSASAAGLALKAAGRGAEVKEAADLDAEAESDRIA